MTDLDLDAIECGYRSPRDCAVCVGISPAWDGHDVNPPCRGYVWQQIPALVAEVKRLRGVNELLVAQDAEDTRVLGRLADRVAEVERERDEAQANIAYAAAIVSGDARWDGAHQLRVAEARLEAAREASKRHPPKAWGARAQYNDGWYDAMNKITDALAVPAGTAQPDACTGIEEGCACAACWPVAARLSDTEETRSE